MTLLFLTAFPPCQKTAGQNYTRQLLNDLVEKGHSVSLVYFSFPGHDVDVSPEVKILKRAVPSVKNSLRLLNVFPFFSKRFDKSVLELIDSIKDDFDMLYFDFSQVHLYSLFVSHPCKVLMCHDVICQKARRQFPLFLPWVRRCEKKYLQSAQHIVTFSKKDSLLIKDEYGLESAPVHFYLKAAGDYGGIQVENSTFCFYGAWNRDENSECLLWFIKKVLPLLKRNFNFKVIGGGMSERLYRKICAVPGFSCAGFVADPVAEIARCEALIAPLHKGAGVKVKVIDALTSGTKVLGTDVAFEGIEDNETHKLFIRCSSPKDFADALNGWSNSCAGDKSAARSEFYARYNTGRFTELCRTWR